MTVLPNVRSAVWWAYTIGVNGQAIGNLQSFNPTSSKTIERVREILFSSGNKVVDIVPGSTDISASVERILLFSENLFQSIGRNLVSIEDFNDPFDVLETLNRPGSSTPVRTVYADCLISEYGRNITTGTTFVSETATFQISTIRPGT